MTTQLATTKAEDGTLKQLIESDRFKLAIASSLPRHLRPDRFIRVALTALTRTPKLAQCDQASFFQCLLTLSQFGLEPDGRNAHLIPFENRKRGVTECQLIVDFKGLCDLAMRSGKVAYIHADKVCENDVFDYDKGSIKVHRIDFKQPRGNPYAYYAICHFKDGTEKCEAMTKEDVEKIRQRSRAKDSGPWVTDFDEMAKKTVFRRLSKWLQLSPEYRDALEADSDSLEEHRFEDALPVIGRPVIGGKTVEPNGEAPAESTEKPSKPANGRRKLKVIKASDKTPAEPEPAPKEEPDFIPWGPNTKEVDRRLTAGGYTVVELLQVAIKNQWLDPFVEELDKVPLGSIDEEKLGEFAQDWDLVSEQIDALRAARKDS